MMKSVIFRGDGVVEVVQSAAPQDPGPNEVKVAMKSVAIDGTDISSFEGFATGSYPLIGGHEAAGVVMAVGSNVTNLSVGQRVLLNPLEACGQCYQCLRAFPSLCPNGGLMGREVDGAYREALVISRDRVYPVATAGSFGAITVLQTLATCVYGYSKVRQAVGHTAVVLGLGVSGFLFVQLAKLFGAGRVLAVSRSKWKLELAERLGADAAVPAVGSELKSAVLAHNDEVEPDVVVETAGQPETSIQAVDLARAGGNVIQFGTLHGSVDGYPVDQLYFKDLSVFGTRASRIQDYTTAIKLAESGRIDLESVVTHKFSFDEAADAFALATNPGGERVLRIVLEP